MTQTSWMDATSTLTKALLRPTKAPADLERALQTMHSRAEGALPQVSLATGLTAEPVPVRIVTRHGISDATFGLALKALGLDENGDSGASRAASFAIAPLLAFMSCQVLGLYDGYNPEKQLLLCAPNMLKTAQDIGDRREFVTDLVCLHEQTHRLQDANAPWLTDHIFGLVKTRLHRHHDEPVPQGCKADKQRAAQQIKVVMALIEGHAQMIADDLMRQRYADFDATRKLMYRNQPPITKWTSRAMFFTLPPLRAKRAQYKEGERFCRAVLDTVGMDVLNRMWSSREALPTPEEFAEPNRWLARVQ